MPTLCPDDHGPGPRLAATRAPDRFSAEQLGLVASRFEARAARSRWCGVGTVGRAEVARLVLFAAWANNQFLTLTPFSDGSFELSSEQGRVLRRDFSLGRLLAAVEGLGSVR